MKDKGIFVTGGTGFLGSYILRDLLQNGYRNLWALRRITSPMSLVSDIADQVHWVEGDVLDIDSLEDAIRECPIVIHAAAMISFAPSDKWRMFEVNIRGTANVVNLCLHHGAQALVHVSSVAALGRLRSGMTIDEETEWQDSTFNSNYGISKHLSEREVWRGKAEGLGVAIVNPSYILGAGFWEDGPTSLYRTIDRGMSFFPKGTNGVVDVRDVARMCRLLVEERHHGQRYICCAANMSYYDLFSSIARHLQKASPTRPITPWIAGIGWRWEWVKSKFTRKKPLVTRETVMYSAHDFLYDNRKSKEALHFDYTEAEITIAQTCRVYRESAAAGRKFGLLEALE